MKLLLLCHVEESFRHLFPDMYVQRLVQACQQPGYRVVHLTSGIYDDHPIKELLPYVNQEIDFAWGYNQYQFRDDESELRWVINSKSPYDNHAYTWVPYEFRKPSFFRGYEEIITGGGCYLECYADFTSVLDALGVQYREVVGYHYARDRHHRELPKMPQLFNLPQSVNLEACK